MAEFKDLERLKDAYDNVQVNTSKESGICDPQIVSDFYQIVKDVQGPTTTPHKNWLELIHEHPENTGIVEVIHVPRDGHINDGTVGQLRLANIN